MYHYAGNNPVKYTDPDGRIAFCAATALIGAGLGAAYGVFLPANSNSVNNLGGNIHSTLHTTNYYETVNSMLSACSTKQEVLETLNIIKTMLQNGEF